MNRSLRKLMFIVVLCVMVFALAQVASASGVFLVTTDDVRLRSGPSTDDDIIKVLFTGTRVEVLEHDPAGWSKVSEGGATGYIRSDFLTISRGSAPVAFKTTDIVRFRNGPSTDDSVIRALNEGTSVEVLEHDPAGWSKVRFEGTVGYIRSDYLTLAIQSSAQTTAAPAAPASTPAPPPPPTILRTNEGVNFRTGPSTDSEIISALIGGTAVEVLEFNPNGWSRVKYNGTVGYIRSDLLSVNGGGIVELLDWSEARNIIQIGMTVRIIDVRTGMSYNIRCFSKSGHADVEPPTREDTDAIFRSRNNVWAWDPRPVWVVIGNRMIAASLNGQPHDVSTISDNGMNGHLCLHFNNTVANNKSYERDLNNAVMEAWNASR